MSGRRKSSRISGAGTKKNKQDEIVEHLTPIFSDATTPLPSSNPPIPRVNETINPPLPAQPAPVAPPPPPEYQYPKEPLLQSTQFHQPLAQYFNQSSGPQFPYPPFMGTQILYPFPPGYQMQVPYLANPYWFTPNSVQVQPQQSTFPNNYQTDLVQRVSLQITRRNEDNASNSRDPRTRSKTKSSSNATISTRQINNTTSRLKVLRIKWKPLKKITTVSKPDYKNVKQYSLGVADPRLLSDGKDCDYNEVAMELCEDERSSDIYDSIRSPDDSLETATDRSIDTPEIPENPLFETLVSFQDVTKNTKKDVKANASGVGSKCARAGGNASDDQSRVGGDIKGKKRGLDNVMEDKRGVDNVMKDKRGVANVMEDKIKIGNVMEDKRGVCKENEDKCGLFNVDEVHVIKNMSFTELLVSHNLIGEKVRFIKKLDELLTMGLESLQKAMEKKINKKTALPFKLEELKFQDLEEEAQKFIKNEKQEYQDLDTAKLLTYRDSVFDSKNVITRSRNEYITELGGSCGQSVVDRMFDVLFQFQDDYSRELTAAVCDRCDQRLGSKSSSKLTTNVAPELVDLTLSDEDTERASDETETSPNLQTNEPVLACNRQTPKTEIIAETRTKSSTILSSESPDSSIDSANQLTPLPSSKNKLDPVLASQILKTLEDIIHAPTTGSPTANWEVVTGTKTIEEQQPDISNFVKEAYIRSLTPMQSPEQSLTDSDTSLNALKVTDGSPKIPPLILRKFKSPSKLTTPLNKAPASNQNPAPANRSVINTITHASAPKLPVRPKAIRLGFDTLEVPLDLSTQSNFEIPAKKAKHRPWENFRN